jgi:hypothetical protein
LDQLPSRILEIVDEVVSALDRDLLSPEWAERVTPGMHPTTGLCSVAAEAVYFLAGGPNAGLRSMVAREEDGGTHWWLVHMPTGTVVDPTAEQYTSVGQVPPYDRGLRGRPCGFQGMRVDEDSPFGFGRSPGRRAARLIERTAGIAPAPR